MDWNQWNAQRGATTTAPAAAGLQPPGGYPGATPAGGMSAPVPPVGAVPPAAAAPVGGYPMGYPYYGSPGMPSVPGYNPQWAMGTQQQNWQQWEQWQQQYAQWHQQYGTKYQQQMAAMQGVPGAAGVGVTPGMPPTTMPSAAVEQPKDMPSYNTADTFGQQKSSSDLKTAPSIGDKRSLDDGKGDSTPTDSKKSKSSDSKKETLEELIEAEKAFDVQFKNWESQFDKWKEQNVNHPDKTQYREYESKWESWREQLIQKREQMKKKREVKMEEIKQETAKAAAEAAASVSAAANVSAAAAAATGSMSSTTSAPPTMYNTATSGYPTPGQVPPGGGYPSMMTGHPPMFGSPFPGGYNNQPYGSPVGPNQQPPFMNQGVAPPMYPPSMNMPPPMMNMGMPPMLSQPTPDVGSASLNTSHDKQSSNVDQSKDHQSNNSQLGFVGSSSSNQGNKGIPGLDLLSGGSSGQGNKNDSNFRGGRGGNDLGYPEPVNKSQPLLKTSDDCKAFDFPKSDQGSRFSGGPDPNSGFGGPQPFGKPPFGGDNFGNMKQPPSFSQFNLPPPKMGGPFEGDSPFRNKQGIPSLMDGFDKNRGPPPGLMDKKDNKDGNKNFDDDFKGGPGSRFSGSRWGPEGDSPVKSSRWGESDLPPDESTNFSRGSVGSKDGPDRFRSGGGGPNDDDRFLGPRGGNFRDRFPPRGPFDRPFDDFPDRPPFGGDKFGPGPTGPRDFDDKLNDPGRSLGDRQGPRGGFTDIDDRFGDQDDRAGPGPGPGPRGGPDFPGRNEFGDRFPRGGPNGPGDRFGFKDGPDRFPDLRGPGDGPDRFGGPRDERDRPFGPRGDDFDKFPGLRGPGDGDRFPPRFRGGGGLLGDGPPDRFGGRDNPDDFPNDGPGDGPDRFFPRGPDGGRFGNRFGDSPRAGFDEPGGFNKPGGFGFRDSGDRFSGPDRGFDDDRRSFGGPSGDLPGDRFPRFSDPVTSPGRFDSRGKNDVPPFGGPAKNRPVSLLDLPPIKPPPNIDPDGPMGPPRGRPDLDFDDDRFDSPGNKNWGAGSGGPGPGPSPGSGNNEDWNRFSGPPGPGPSPDRLSDWKRPGSGPPPFPHEVRNEWENMRPSTVVDYGHRPPTSGFGEFDEPESLEPIRTFDYEHGSKRGTANSNRWGGPDGDSRMSGNSRDRSGGGSSGPSPREDRYNRGGPRGSGGFNKDRDSDMHDRDNRNRGPRDDFKYSKDKDNDKYRNSSNSDYDRKSGGNRNKSMNNRERGNDDSTKPPQHTQPVIKEPPVLIDDLLSNANRATRPPKIIIILRGPPGSGKTYFAKLVKDKEVEMSGSAPRILSLDDYFIVETDREEKDPETGRKVNKKVMEYEYEANMEPHYRTSLLKAFKKTISDGYFPFIVIDCVNDKISHYEEMYSFGKQNGFQVYIAEMDMDVSACAKRNIHKRTEKDINTIVKNWEPTPPSHITLDTRSFLQAAAITDVVMEDSVPDDKSNSNSGQNEDGVGDDKDKNEEIEDVFTSKWEKMEFTGEKLDKLDGLVKARRTDNTIEDWLQLPENYFESTKESSATPGKKKVRWADLEERREQEKMRAIGFVVGQTDWSRMMDPSLGGSKLTQTKYI